MQIPINRSFFIIVAAAVAASAVLLFTSFDRFYFCANDLVGLSLLKHGTFDSIFGAASVLDRAGECYQPLADALVHVQFHLFGGSPLPYVMVIVATHLLCALLLFFVARAAIGAPAAAMATLFFAWHPAAAERFSSVLVASRWGFLLLFLLLSLWGYSYWRKKQCLLSLGLGALFMVCASAMGSWFALPAIVFIYDLACPRGEEESRWLKRLPGQVILWIAFAIPVATGYYFTDKIQSSGASIAGFKTLIDLLAAGVQSGPLLFEPVHDSAGLTGFMGFKAVGLGILGLLIAGLFISGFRFRQRFAKPLLSSLLLCLVASIPAVSIERPGVDGNSAGSLYLVNAFLSFCAGLLLCGFLADRSAKFLVRAASLVLVPVLACGYGIMTCTLSPQILKPGTWIRDCQEQVMNLIGPEHPEKDPVFLLNTPTEYLPIAKAREAVSPHVRSKDDPAGQGKDLSTGQSAGQNEGMSSGQSAGQIEGMSSGQDAGQNAGMSTGQSAGQRVEQTEETILPLQSLGLAFTTPFVEKAVKLYPLHVTPWLSPELHVPFMLHMWGDGELLKIDENTGRIRKMVPEEIDRSFLGHYWTSYCQGKKPSLIRVQMPAPKMSMPYDRETGFPVIFPYRKAKAERVVMLTRYGAVEVFIDEFTPEMFKRQGRKPYIHLQVWDALLGQALVFFPGESVYMWVESIDDSDAVFHRSKFIRFYLR